MQRAQLKRAKVLEQVVKACTPTPPTMHYGLVVSGGQLLKFDAAGDSKAKEAINVSAVEPGKALRVTVTGVIEAEDTVRVASIESTRRIPAPRASSGQ
jgi:flavoprotein